MKLFHMVFNTINNLTNKLNVITMERLVYINNLLDHRIREIIAEECWGCVYDHPSQKHHMTGCMTSNYHDYVPSTLNLLLKEHFITESEYEYLMVTNLRWTQ